MTEDKNPDYSEKLAILDSFVDKLGSSQVNLDTESQKLLDDNFWELID